MLFELTDRTQLELTGTHRAKFLHGFCTNDIQSLTPGRGCEAFVCNIQGKVLGHIFVFCTETSLWIDSVPAQEDTLFNHLDRYLINEDVQIHRRSAEFGELYLDGPMAPMALNAAKWPAAAELSTQPMLSLCSNSVAQETLQCRLVDWLGDTGWLISARLSLLTEVRKQLQSAGEIIADAAIWNRRRVQAGFPLFGVDFTSDYLAQEIGRTDRCISFRKGCYLGQEPIARIDAIGHVNRKLRPLSVAGDDLPPPGSPLRDPETQTQIGVITSAVISSDQSADFGVAALGTLRKKFCEPGKKILLPTATGSRWVEVR